MILDSLKNSALYHSLNPRLERAFSLIASTDWTGMEPGVHELDGRDIFVNVMDVDLKRRPDAKLEVHDAYIDIQVLVAGTEESFGWSERKDLRQPLGTFDTQKDIQFFDDEPQTYCSCVPASSRCCCPRTAMRRWWARGISARSSSRSAGRRFPSGPENGSGFGFSEA